MILQNKDFHTLKLQKGKIEIIQINLGNKCNQFCSHCHIGASPQGDKNMDFHTANRIIEKLKILNFKCIEFTGGTPELNPNLPMFIEELSNSSNKLAVRTSLTILNEPEYEFYIELFHKHGVKIIASLPSPFKDLTDKQRGDGTFASTIKVLKKLNGVGYGNGKYILELVHNPVGDDLPSEQALLEAEYKQLLSDQYGISFNNLVAITNSPIKRFKNYLLQNSKLEDYIRTLKSNFNPETMDKLMCKHLLSVNYEGYIYDCDFNLALNMRLKGYENIKFWDIDFDNFSPEISFAEHCYACTANCGSSCQGVLVDKGHLSDVRETVKIYYGTELKGTKDLKTSACCTSESLPSHIKKVLPFIAEEIKNRYYGCGSPIPLVLDGLNVLDIGCGTGRDCYILSKLVGEKGFVYGIDMTDSQIAVAQKYSAIQTERFGYEKPNVHFIHDYIENVGKYFADQSLDLVISNCVVNLVENKESLLKEIYRMLRKGGEFYFSDIYADRRLPAHLRKNPLLYSECLGGTLYWKDFERLAKKAGFTDPRIISKRTIDIGNEEIKVLIENIAFYSITYRLWKLDGLEDTCEDYGHIAIYKGGILESPFSFALDDSHIFEKNKPEKVCGNTALMLSQTRFKSYFEVIGDFNKHLGAFKDCRTSIYTDNKPETGGCGC